MTTTQPKPFATSARLSVVGWVARLVGSASRLVGWGGGRTIPGRIALALMPEALTLLAARHRVVLVSGTNGKTTTTLLLTRALGSRTPVISNSDGANLTSGILTTLASAAARRSHVAVFEVDEVALIKVLEQVEAVAGPNRPAHRIHLTP